MGAARMPPVKPWRWTRARYDEAVRTGVIDEDDPVELLDGLLVVREPQSSRHAATNLLVREALQRAFRRGYHVRDHSPVALDAMSEPEPDLAVVAGRPRDYLRDHPARPVLVVEIARTSLARDRVRKGALYARAGLGEYWIVNLRDEVLEVYRDPVRDAPARFRYRTVRILRRGTSVTPLTAPSARIRVAALLP